MNFFISHAIAGTNLSKQDNITSLILTMLIFGFVIYFMVLRPQQKQTKEHKKLIQSIKKDDEILTNGGLIGLVNKVSDNGYVVIALNNITEVVIKRDFITAILPKGTIKAISSSK